MMGQRGWAAGRSARQQHRLLLPAVAALQALPLTPAAAVGVRQPAGPEAPAPHQARHQSRCRSRCNCSGAGPWSDPAHARPQAGEWGVAEEEGQGQGWRSNTRCVGVRCGAGCVLAVMQARCMICSRREGVEFALHVFAQPARRPCPSSHVCERNLHGCICFCACSWGGFIHRLTHIAAPATASHPALHRDPPSSAHRLQPSNFALDGDDGAAFADDVGGFCLRSQRGGEAQAGIHKAGKQRHAACRFDGCATCREPPAVACMYHVPTPIRCDVCVSACRDGSCSHPPIAQCAVAVAAAGRPMCRRRALSAMADASGEWAYEASQPWGTRPLLGHACAALSLCVWRLCAPRGAQYAAHADMRAGAAPAVSPLVLRLKEDMKAAMKSKDAVSRHACAHPCMRCGKSHSRTHAWRVAHRPCMPVPLL